VTVTISWVRRPLERAGIQLKSEACFPWTDGAVMAVPGQGSRPRRTPLRAQAGRCGGLDYVFAITSTVPVAVSMT
jgi:hypothetical protein